MHEVSGVAPRLPCNSRDDVSLMVSAAEVVHAQPEVVLAQPGMSREAIEFCLATGGMVEMPLVKERLTDFFGVTGLRLSDDSASLIAKGAAATARPCPIVGQGCVGIDPTNDKLVDWQYVRVAAGRDYCDVQPLRDVFLGSPRQELEVQVEVRRIG